MTGSRLCQWYPMFSHAHYHNQSVFVPHQSPHNPHYSACSKPPASSHYRSNSSKITHIFSSHGLYRLQMLLIIIMSALQVMCSEGNLNYLQSPIYMMFSPSPADLCYLSWMWACYFWTWWLYPGRHRTVCHCRGRDQDKRSGWGQSGLGWRGERSGSQGSWSWRWMTRTENWVKMRRLHEEKCTDHGTRATDDVTTFTQHSIV